MAQPSRLKTASGKKIHVGYATILGNDKVGYRTAEEWQLKLGISEAALRRRVIMAGNTHADEIFAPVRRNNRLRRIVNRITGKIATRSQHARDLKISTSCFCHREKIHGLNNEKTWRVGPLHGKIRDIWQRESRMALRKNPFTGHSAYDYEWAELYGMSEGSFKDRLILNGFDNIKSWSFCDRAVPQNRTAVTGGINGVRDV